jgi:hypothetical protein
VSDIISPCYTHNKGDKFREFTGIAVMLYVDLMMKNGYRCKTLEKFSIKKVDGHDYYVTVVLVELKEGGIEEYENFDSDCSYSDSEDFDVSESN